MFANDTTRRFGRLTAIWSLALGVVFALGACKDNGSSGNSDEGEKSIGEQVQQADNSEESSGEGGGGKVGPKGPSSIDHGGITSIPDDKKLAEKGKKMFDKKGCSGCHKMKKDLTGPALGGVTERREPEWIARMIMHPDKMIKKDPTARDLLSEYATPMANQGVKPEEAKALIAYLATVKE